MFPLVQEFYSNIPTGAQSFSMVRGVKVSFSASTINMHYGLEDVVDEYDHLLESVSVEELNSILSQVSVEGTKWLPNKGDGNFFYARPSLHPIAKI